MSKQVVNFHYNILKDNKLVETRGTYFDLTDLDLKAITEYLLNKDELPGLFTDIPQSVFDKIHGEAIDDARNHIEGNISDYTITLEEYIPLDLLYLLPEHIQNQFPEEVFNDPDADADLAALRADYL